MAPVKGQKRAYSNVSLEGTDLDLPVPSLRPAAHVKKTRGNDWRSWQNSLRTQEAARVRQYTATFQKDAAATRDRAMATLHRGEEARVKLDEKNLESVREAYGKNATSTAVAATDHPLYVAGREVLDLFHATLGRYEQSNEALQTLKGDNKNTENDRGISAESFKSSWYKDRAEARKLLRYGRVYGDSLVHEIIVPKTGPAAAPGEKTLASATGSLSENNLNQTGRSALCMFPQSRATMAQGQTWGETARSQMQALTGLLKTLPKARSMPGNEFGEAKGLKSVTFDC